MKFMCMRQWAQKGVTFCLTMVVFATYSMVTLAASGKPVGELIITSAADGAVVTVNGEPAKSGRTIFASSTITTPDGVDVVVSLGKAGKIQLSPNSTFTLSGEGSPLSGELSAGNLTLLATSESFDVKTTNGDPVKLNAGETASAGSTATVALQSRRVGGWAWWKWAVLIGAVATVVVIAVVASRDDDSSVVSPTR